MIDDDDVDDLRLRPTGAESLNRNSFSFSDERLNSPTVFSPSALSPPLTSPKRESLSTADQSEAAGLEPVR